MIFKLIILCFSLNYVSPSDADIDKLLQHMDIEDKCGQMTQITFEVIQKNPNTAFESPIDMSRLRTALVDYKVGSILNTPNGVAQKAKDWQEIIKQIQNVALNETKHKIPVIYGIDSIHGANYIQEAVLFPQPLAQACTFNVDFVRKIGEITARETRATGIPWNFSPVLDVGRQPLWPRLFETYGEDVYLNSKLGEAYISGHQGDNLSNRTKAATCLKHFIGYSFPFNGRDRSVSWIPEILLRETFLPPFESGIKAGSLTVMINSGDVNGLPGHANHYFITEILKGELNFTGFTVSDWQDIIRLHTRDKVADTEEEAVRLAVMAGVDMSMVPYDFSFFEHCVNLSKKDSNFRLRIDDAVKRILTVKKKLGLFETSYPFPEDLNLIGTQESEDFNLEVARESLILAKNDDKILPIKGIKRILVTGPTGDLIKVLNGGWSYTWQGDEQSFENFGRKKYTILDAIKKRSSIDVMHVEGANFISTTNLADSVNAAKQSDLVVLCLGEDTYIEFLGNTENLMLSDSQVQLSNAIIETGKPIILVYVGGRPRIITEIVKKSKAVILAFLPGNRGGEAIADLLFGDFNPSGKLPISYPNAPNSLVNYDCKVLDDFSYSPGFGNFYNPLFKFGHGLSYTQFEYSNLVLDNVNVTYPNPLFGNVTVKNIGDREGKETIIVYLNDEYASISRPKIQMKIFEKINLLPNEAKTLRFKLTIDDMSFIDYNNQRITEQGAFNVFISDLSSKFYLVFQNEIINEVPDTITIKISETTTSTPNSADSNIYKYLQIKLIFIGFFVFFECFKM